MDWAYSVIWFFFSFFVALFLWYNISRNGSSRERPPGPPGWPVIGNILDMGLVPHQNLFKLQAKYGPLLWLKLGMRNTLVVQSAKAAEQLFKKHDLSFSNRTVFDSLTACGYNKGSPANASYGEYWRMVRKLFSSELFVQKRISASAPIRQNCIDVMVDWMKEDTMDSRASGNGEIELHRYFILMTFNLVSNFLLSKDIIGSKFERGNKFCEALNGFMDWCGKPNLVDTFPLFQSLVH